MHSFCGKQTSPFRGLRQFIRNVHIVSSEISSEKRIAHTCARDRASRIYMRNVRAGVHTRASRTLRVFTHVHAYARSPLVEDLYGDGVLTFVCLVSARQSIDGQWLSPRGFRSKVLQEIKAIVSRRRKTTIVID